MLTYGDLKPGDLVEWIEGSGVLYPVEKVNCVRFAVQNQAGPPAGIPLE